MKLPNLSVLPTSRDMIDSFGGYNHNIRIGENEFYDMKNLSSSSFPTLAPRKNRGTYSTSKTENDFVVGIIEKDSLCQVVYRLGKLYFLMNNYEYELGYTDIDETFERNLISMGAYVVIMPDKLYINTANPTEEKGQIEAKYPVVNPSETDVTQFSVCRMDGTSWEINFEGVTEPETTVEGKELPDGYVWLDNKDANNPSLKQYSKATGMWSSVATTYIKITATGLGQQFKEYDGVTISGITVDDALAEHLNDKTHLIYSVPDDNSIVVIGLLNACGFSQEGFITVERWMPEMDFIIESNNRLWGCRYGTNRNGEAVNEIYASKLGDFKNWNCFSGTSIDSYYVSVGTDGQFTGAISYLGLPLFFKENCLHTVYGSYPAQYQVQDTACRGVQKGSEKSLAMVNEVLYYKSRTGVCAYSGSLPSEISSVLGDKAYKSAIACSYKGKYYISMFDVAEKDYAFFVCDTSKGMWHKEDNLKVRAFCVCDDEIYFLGDDGENKSKVIRTLFGSGEKDTAPIKWMAETGVLGLSSPDRKYLTRIAIRLKLGIGARVTFYISYDSSGVWERVCSIVGHNLKAHTLPIKPKRCDHFRLKIEGEGEANIFSISKISFAGSDK